MSDVGQGLCQAWALGGRSGCGFFVLEFSRSIGRHLSSLGLY